MKKSNKPVTKKCEFCKKKLNCKQKIYFEKQLINSCPDYSQS